MADAHEHSVEELRKELEAMREQMDALLQTLKDKAGDLGGEASSHLAQELEKYRQLAQERAGKVYEAGAEGMEEISEKVRRNPMTSLLIAFGAGCILSGLFSRSR